MAHEITQAAEQLPAAPIVDIGAGGELQVAGNAAAALQEIQATVMVAKRFPRNTDKAFGRLMQACARKTMATSATYSFPRGGSTVSGPSVNLARVAAQCWENVRWGLDILRDDPDSVHIRGWAWDVETNVKVAADDSFRKVVQRKPKGGGKAVDVRPDERDLRELINRRGAILVRNCLLQIIPKDLIEDAMGVCKQTIKDGIKDPKGERKRLILGFQSFGVTVDMLAGYLGTADWTTDELVTMTEILNALQDGQAKVSDFFGGSSADGDSNSDTKGNGHQSVGDDLAAKAKAVSGHKAETAPEQDAADLLKEIGTLEAKANLGKDTIDLRTEHAGFGDLSSATREGLLNYRAFLQERTGAKTEAGATGKAGF